MTETQIVRSILDYLAVRNIFAWRQNTGAGKFTGKDGAEHYVKFGLKGQPDITGILPDGRRLDIECKSVTGRLSPEQAHFIAALKNNGGCAFVARSVDDVVSELDKILKESRKNEI
jgi:hypothetical protein